MKINDILLAELKYEAKSTRDLLELIPFDKSDFKPHVKSMKLQRIAVHCAEISGWWKECLVKGELDFSDGDFTPKACNSLADILALHDTLISNAKKNLAETSEDEFQKMWTTRNGEQIYFTIPKASVDRFGA